MYFDPGLLLYGAVFVATLLLIEGAYYLIHDLRGGSQRAVNRRMRMISEGTDTHTALRKLRRDSKDPLSRILASFVPSLDKLILHAGLTISVARLLVIMAIVWMIVFGMIEILTPTPILVSLLMASILGIGLPYIYLLRKRSQRLKSFGEQLPDSLDLVVRGLRAGHPASAALSLVAREMPDPIGTEFGIVIDEMTYGLDLADALDNLSDRVPHQDLQFLVVTIQIQYMVGGNLAEVLATLSKVIRDRYQMFAKIKAVTAEGRASAIVIGACPIVFVGIILVTSPGFFMKVIGDPLFWPLMGGAAATMMVGQYILFKLVNFEV